MSYDPRPEAAPVARNKQTLSAEQCRAINATLPPRLKCAVLHGRRGKAMVFVERPRNAGRAPKRGVYIPPPARSQKGLAKVSKHARQQTRDGKFGRQGERTIERKLAFLASSAAQANVIAKRRSEEQRARRFEAAVLNAKPGQSIVMIGRRFHVLEAVRVEVES